MDGKNSKIGVLALQGAFIKHLDMLAHMGVEALPIRYPDQLSHCRGLIIPGGESTAMNTLIQEIGFLNPLREFSYNRPIFGTCAGVILMTTLLGLFPITIERNAYGRQSASFCVDLQLAFTDSPLRAFFIRAPQIASIASSEVSILAKYEGKPVCIQQGIHIGATFHPELSESPLLHRHFLSLCDTNPEK